MDTLQGLVGVADPELSLHLETQGLKPILYAMRWVTLMLSQEFALPDVLRLWDSILAQEEARRLEWETGAAGAAQWRSRRGALRRGAQRTGAR